MNLYHLFVENKTQDELIGIFESKEVCEKTKGLFEKASPGILFYIKPVPYYVKLNKDVK